MWRRLVTALGLNDRGGDLSFNKTVTAVLTATVVWAILHQLEVGTNLLILSLGVLFGGFGLKGLSLFATMYRRTDSVALTGDAAKVVDAIRQRRDPAAGVDPA